MATAITGGFYLTQAVVLPAATASGVAAQATIDLSAYVNVPTGQSVAIRGVDFVYQRGSPFGQDAKSMLAGNGCISVQLTDLNQGANLVRADNQSLIASGALNVDQANNIATQDVDLYPDSHGGSKLNDSFMVVNDTLFLTAMPSGTTIGSDDVSVVARISCEVVKLSQANWIAIAIQSTADQ